MKSNCIFYGFPLKTKSPARARSRQRSKSASRKSKSRSRSRNRSTPTKNESSNSTSVTTVRQVSTRVSRSTTAAFQEKASVTPVRQPSLTTSRVEQVVRNDTKKARYRGFRQYLSWSYPFFKKWFYSELRFSATLNLISYFHYLVLRVSDHNLCKIDCRKRKSRHI